MLTDSIIITLFTLFSIFIKKLYTSKKNKNKNKVIPNITPAELKYHYSSLVNERDLASIIINLAQKKYIKISMNKDPKIIKLKKYKEKNKSEELMYKSLFKKGNSVKINDIHKNLYKDISDIVHSIDNKKLRNEMNEKEEVSLNNLLVSLTFIIFLIINIHLPYRILKNIIITIITWISFISLVRVYTSKNNLRSKILITLLVLFISAPFYTMIFTKIQNNIHIIFIFVLGHISTFIIINTLKSLIPKTETGIDLKNEAELFNNYLINIKKENIKKILQKEPDFLEKTFPYAYAFNHTFKWKRLLKKYNKKLEWFDGTEIELTEILIKIRNQIVKSGHKEK